MPPKKKAKTSKGSLSQELTDECGEVLKWIMDKPDVQPYSEPVDWEYYGLTDYPQIITEPMDLGTIKEKLSKGKYDSVDAFIYDGTVSPLRPKVTKVTRGRITTTV